MMEWNAIYFNPKQEITFAHKEIKTEL